MGLVETVKEAVMLVQRLDNIELVKSILALQTQVQEVLDENRSLKVRVTELEGMLA